MTDPLDQLRQHFTNLWLREEGPQGRVYVGHDATGAEVTIAVLAETLAAQPSIRNAFADVVWRHSVGSQPGRATVYAADLHAAHPWAATRGRAGQPGAEQLLSALAGTAPTAAMPAAPLPPPPPPLPAGLAPVTPTPTPTFTPTPTPTYQAYLPVPPPKQSRPLPWVLGGAAVLVVLLGAAAAIGVIALRDDPDPPVTLPTTSPPAPPPPTATDSPGPEPTEEPAGEPELREVELVSVVGPNFAPGDDTFTMAFRGWPFAFRAPGDWNCFRGDPVPLYPGAEIWSCVGAADSGQRAIVMLWECDSECDEDEQQDKIETWLDEPDQAVQWDDSPTHYVETEDDGEGNYTVDLGHFFGTEADGLRWMTGIFIESPADTREDVQKLLNDIISQTS
jgi:hypothetical protein